MADTTGISSLCHCSDHPAVHVHCFCAACKGKAVNYRTQRAHSLSSAVFNTHQRTAVQKHLEEREATTEGKVR